MTAQEALDKLDKTVLRDLEWKIALTNALEKQIPKKPKNLTLAEGIMTTMFECPVCRCRRLGHGFDLNKCFCPECGQKLDWN